MRLFLLLMMFLTFAFGGEYWVQVASVKSADALTSEFMKKVDGFGLEKKIVVGKKWCRVYLGHFDREIDALEVLPTIRCKVASDAYIVSRIDDVPLVPAMKAPENMVVDAMQMPAQEPVVSKETVAVKEEITLQTAVKQSNGFGVEDGKKCRCICDPKAFKKAKMKEALAFYKNSHDYKFSYKEKKLF